MAPFSQPSSAVTGGGDRSQRRPRRRARRRELGRGHRWLRETGALHASQQPRGASPVFLFMVNKDYSWMIHGLFMGYSWVVHGLLMVINGD